MAFSLFKYPLGKFKISGGYFIFSIVQIFQAVGLVVEIENVISTLVVVVIGCRLDVDASVEMLVQRVVDSRAVVDLTESIVHKMDVLGDMGRIDIVAIIYSLGV